jgi:tyrosine-protein kinase Etk/Wzc
MPALNVAARDEISLREILDLVLAGRWSIVKIAGTVLFLGLALCYLLPPSFVATGVVQIDDESKTSAMQQFGELPSFLSGAVLETAGELEILQTRLILDPVIEQMNLEIVAYPKHFPIIGSAISRLVNGGTEEPVSVPSPFRGWAWGGEDIVVDTLEVPRAWLNDSFNLRVTEEGYTLSEPWGDDILSGKVGELAASPDGKSKMRVSSLKGRPGTSFSVTRFSHDDTVLNLLGRMTIAELGTSSGVISIGFSGPARKQVADFINNLEQSYLQQNIDRHSLDAQRSLEFLERQLPELKKQMLVAQAQLAQYQQTHSAPDLASETQVLLEGSAALETRRLGLVTQLDQAKQLYQGQHPAIQVLNQQLRSVEQEQARYKSRLAAVPSTQQDVFNLTRDVQAYSQLYNAMLASIQNFQVAKAGTIGNVRIVDMANEPFRPSFPRLMTIAPLALAMGLLLGVIWVFIQRGMLRGIDNPADVEVRLGLPTLALVPYSKQQRKMARQMRKSETGSHILANDQPEEAAVEALRSLRTSLEFTLLDSRNNVVMFCGAAPDLGKTFITVNFADILVQSGKRVVILEADLRRGRLHNYFGRDTKTGVTDFVQQQMPLDEVIHSSDIPGLDYVPRGPHPRSPTDILLHPRFAELIDQLSKRYDFVLIDTPPVLAVTDAAIVGRHAGTSLLVLKCAVHRMSEIEETLKRLASAEIQIRGTIFNQFGARAGSYGYGNYGYRYYEYQG